MIIVDVKVRMPKPLREQIEREAKKNKRSMNSEVLYRLGVSFGREGAKLTRQYDKAAHERLEKILELLSQREVL